MLGSQLNNILIAPGQIGYELAEESESGYVSLKRLIQWNYVVTNLFNSIKGLLTTFPMVAISEYWDNAFQLKIPKREGVTIGFLFGYFNEIKDSFSEYSICQTSLEQIFNQFANQDDFENPVVNHEKFHKPEIKVDREFLNLNFNS